MSDAFTIRIFVPDGDPEGVRVVDRMNWTGIGVTFPRDKWQEAKRRTEFDRTGVYILIGYMDDDDDDDDLQTVYIGQADNVRNRIEAHYKNKDFWEKGIVFVSTSGGLNRAHVTWLEYELIKQANKTKRCKLENSNIPEEPTLTEAEKADTRGFLKEILQILPLVDFRAFAYAKPITPSKAKATVYESSSHDLDTVIVPAKKEGFKKTFLGENCWHAIRISAGKLEKIKYIAAYQTHPVSAITHYALVDRIEPYGQSGKYRVIFSGKAQPFDPIKPYGDKRSGVMQGLRYTTFEKLKNTEKLSDILKG